MGLFFPSDPIVHGQRAKGLPRYQELLERDWKSFLFADFVTLGLWARCHGSSGCFSDSSGKCCYGQLFAAVSRLFPDLE